MVCKSCGREKRLGARGYCGACYDKILVIPKFAKARDDLRQKVGLPRMTKGSEYYDG